MPDDPISPPPRGLTSSPSIFAYQTRIMDRATPPRGSPRGHSSNTSTSSVAARAAGFEASAESATPRSQPSASAAGGAPSSVAARAANFSAAQAASTTQTPSKVHIGHRHGMSKSVDMRAWEDRIQASGATTTADSTPKASKRYTLTSPPAASSAFPPKQSAAPSTPDSFSARFNSGQMARGSGRTMSIDSSRSIPESDPVVPPSPALSSVSASSSTRPPSVASYTSVLSPASTGNSSASGRSQSVEDTLAAARANALKRREAKMKAAGGGATKTAAPASAPLAASVERTAGGTLKAAPAEEETKVPTLKAAPNLEEGKVPNLKATPVSTSSRGSTEMAPPAVPSTPRRKAPETDKNGKVTTSPFSHLFTPPSASEAASSSSNDKTPTSRPSAASSGRGSSRYAGSGLGVGAPPDVDIGAKGRYGSISGTDRRRLGRHLPRVASGSGGEALEGASDKPPQPRETAARRIPSNLNLRTDAAPVAPAAPASPSPSHAISKKRSTDILTPSAAANKAPVPPSPTVPSTPTSKRRSAYLAHISKGSVDVGASPRVVLQGNEMKGLMHAVGGAPARGKGNVEGEGVTGMANRMRLSKATLPPSASSAQVAPAPLPSRRLAKTDWMDRQRHALGAYEYLCHVGEAVQWVEGVLDEELGVGVVEMEEALWDGVILAKIARKFLGDSVVRVIHTDNKHRYLQTDNINHFLNLVRSVGMPETFVPDTTDLYNKRNVPKVIFCLHVLSHLLARLGRAERIGNLVGQFEFTDEQLAATQKGLQGVAMPNFGDAKATLAKEASWEPEEPEETEDELRDRLLLENEDSIRALQRHLRGRLARQRVSRTQAKLDLAEPSVVQIQARARAYLSRKAIVVQRDERSRVQGSVTSFQAAARSRAAQGRYHRQVQQVRAAEAHVRAMQAQARGVLARVRLAAQLGELDKARRGITTFQAVARSTLAARERTELRAAVSQPEVTSSVAALQALLRGQLHRQAEAAQIDELFEEEMTYLRLQAHLRGVLARRVRKAEEKKLDDASDVVVAIQAVCRGVLARRRKQEIVRAVAHALPVSSVSGLQAFARAKLAKQNHQTMRKALAKVEVALSVGGLQAFLRSKLAKKSTQEQKKKLEFVSPDVIGFQAHARGFIARQEHREWVEYLHDPHTLGALVFLQSLIRGFNARRTMWYRTSHYHNNVDKITLIQALWRGRVQRRMYDRLLTGYDVDVPTVQNYMHLLTDTERDFADQMQTEVLRKNVLELVRDNQVLETETQELETKIALIVKNKMSFEEMAKAKRRLGGAGAGAGAGGAAGMGASGSGDGWSVGGQGDPFSGVHLDRASQRKLELFEHLFFTLQTKPDYLARLCRAQSESVDGEDDGDRERRLVQGVVLALFAPGAEKREEYLFHKLLQLSIHTDVLAAGAPDSLVNGRFSMQSTTMAYIRDALAPWVQQVLTPCIATVVHAAENLDLCTDPLEIYHRLIKEDELRTGRPSDRPRDRDADQVLQTDGDARALYIQHLQELRHLTESLLKELYMGVLTMPYTVRYLVREAFLALRIKYDGALDNDLTPLIAKTFLLPFIVPALLAPEKWGIADPQNPLGPSERRNLAAIAGLLGIVADPEADGGIGGGAPAGAMATMGAERWVRTPLQAYIGKENAKFVDWIVDLAAVEPLESYFEAHELFESTMEAKPVTLTRNEIYGMLSVLMKNIGVVTGNRPKDPVAIILQELEGAPIAFDKGKTPVSLRLTNRLAELAPGDPENMIKEDYVQAKRHVLAVLRIQTGRTLYDVLVARPEEVHEMMWLQEVHRDIELEDARARKVGLPPRPQEEYQIESIRSLPFHEVKSRAIEFCMKLERAGKITRKNAYQDMLVSIAGDIRSKHHLRKMQRQALAAMIRANEEMSAKKRAFEQSVQSFHTFIDSSMANLQKGKKKPAFLSKQYRHQWQEERHGRKAQFGSFKYTAHDLYEKGILLGINQCSPRQFDKIYIVIASNEVGVFSIEMSSPASHQAGHLGSPSSSNPASSTSGSGATPALMGHEEVRMEDLLSAQFDNELNLLLFEGMATFSINNLIHQINKSGWLGITIGSTPASGC